MKKKLIEFEGVLKEAEYKIIHFGNKNNWDHGSVWMKGKLLYAW